MTRKVCFVLGLSLLLFVGACYHDPLCIDEEDPIALTDEERWMNYICSPARMGRKAGTEGCDSVAVYLQRELVGMGYDVQLQPFRFKDSLDLRNLYIEIKGDSDSLVVLGAHYDGAKNGKKYPAADDNGSGVVTLLSLCKFYSQNGVKPPKTLIAGFWAAEEVTGGSAFNGSRYFVQTFDGINRVKCYCNFDCFGRKNQGAYFYYSHGYETVGDIMSGFFFDAGYTIIDFTVKENEKRSSDYMSFYAANIPYFGWNDYDNSGFIHSTDDTVAKISFDKIRAIVSLTTKLIEKL